MESFLQVPSVLNVDDSDERRRFRTTVLEAAGFTVLEAENGGEAFHVARDQQPSLVLLDVELPDVNGFEVCRRLKADPATQNIPVLHISAACVNDEHCVEGLRGGADSYLTEPINSEVLVEVIRTLLRRSATEADAREARREAEQALRVSERRYRSLFQYAPYGICHITSDGRFLTANEALARMLGYDSGDDLIAEANVLQFYADPADRSRLIEEIERRHTIKDAEVLWRRQNGEPIRVRISSRRIETGYEAFIEDVTERHVLESQLRQSQKLEAVGQLAGGIAHDFNNLLTVIIGYSKLVRPRVRNQPDIAEDIEEIEKAGERASRLTRQLLAFSRKQLLVSEVLDLNQVVGDLNKMLRRVISEDIRLDIVAAPSLGRTKTDRGCMEQLLMNLVVNARDAMPKGGTLTIETANAVLDSPFVRRHIGSKPGHYVSLVVKDTGCGMAPEVLAHVFEPFFTTKGPDEGTGLGLSTAYGIVKQSGGHITVESTPGVGTTFTIYLPRVEDVVEARGTETQPMTTLKGTETILLVEDEEGVRVLLRKMLEEYGYTVLQAQDVNDAIAIGTQHPGPIHLLVSDIVMPRLNGPDLAQLIVRRRPMIRVLYVSGFADQVAVERGSISQNASFLQKPFAAETLATKVRERLDHRIGQRG